MNFLKKQTVSTWLSLVALILCIVAVILYGANVSGAGYFHSMTSGTVVAASVFEIIILAAILVVSQFNFNGIIGYVVGIVLSAAKIVAAFLPLFALLALVNTRIEGLSFIFFGDEAVLVVNQTPENLASSYTAIASCIFYFLTTLVGIVGAFFRPYKKVKKTAEAAA